MLTVILDCVVLLAGLALAARAAQRAMRYRVVRSADLICGMIFLFYVMPLAYDWALPGQPPDYFYAAFRSPTTHVQYDVIVLASLALIQLGAIRRWPPQQRVGWSAGFTLVPLRPAGLIPLFVNVGWVVLLLPLPAVLLLSGNPAAFFEYGAIVQLRHHATPFQSFMITVISAICVLALMGFFVIYWVRARYTRSAADPVRWLAILLALVAVWIHGKRTIIAFLLIIIVFINFLERRLRWPTVLLYLGLGILGGYLYIGIAKGYERSPLEYLRGDLARDYTLRHVIHRSDWTASSIVPYRGASYLFSATAYVPRAVWPSKPWPAPVYLTNDVFNRQGEDYLGWGFGLGFMEELIMNFGYLGIAGCFFIGWFSAWLDKFIYSRSSYYAILWVPLTFGTIFASSVILKVLVFVVFPALLLARVFASPRAWVPLRPQPRAPLPGATVHTSRSGQGGY